MLTQKNICLLIYDLRSGGAERVLCQWSQMLAKQFNVFLTVFDGNSKIAYDFSGTYSSLDVPSKKGGFFTKALVVFKRSIVLKKFVKKNQIDIIVSFGNEANLANHLALCKAKKICSIRAQADLYKNRFVKYVVKSLNNVLIVQTNALKEEIKNKIGISLKKKIIVFGNPFNTKKILEMSMREENLPCALELCKGRIIVCVASFKEQKNHQDLIKSFELLCNDIDDVCLLLIGADNGTQSIIMDMASKSVYSDRIIFGGETNNPYAVLKKSTAFVMTSFFEGMPNALAEAMICGVPVISVDCPTGPRELLTDNNEKVSFPASGFIETSYGVLVNCFTRKSSYDIRDKDNENIRFALAMKYALNNSDILKRLEYKSLEGAKRFDIDSYKNDLIALMEGIICS